MVENKVEEVWYIENNELIKSNKIISKINYRGMEFAVLRQELNNYNSSLLIKDEQNIYWNLGIASIKMKEFIKVDEDNTMSEYCDNIYKTIIDFDFEKFFSKKIELEQYFNKCELRYISMYFPKLYDNALKSRENYIDNRQKENEQEKLRIKEQNEQKVNETNKVFEDKLFNIKQNIIQDKCVVVEDLEYYKDNKYENGITTQNCILYLAKEYGIKIPLATPGFINNRLVNYDFGSGSFAFKIINGNNRASETMYKYLKEISKCVKEENKQKVALLKNKILEMKGGVK